jgi:excisionase family DNA binding protein
MPAPRFLSLTDVAEVLNISSSQTYALVRSGELPAIKIGGKGTWRVEAAALEDYIARCYAETKAFVATHPLGRDSDAGEQVDVDDTASAALAPPPRRGR